MTDPAAWKWWQDALAGSVGPIHDDSPQQGFYRVRRKDGPWEPLAIWQDELGLWFARRGDKDIDAKQVWTWACRNPVTHEAWKHACETGRFSDEPPELPASGHNLPADPLERVKLELAAEQDEAARFLAKPIETDDDANRAAAWAKRVAELAKRADDLRDQEKRPHDEASKAVQAKWKPVVDEAKALCTRLKDATLPFLSAKRRKQEQEERARREAEEAARLAAAKAAGADAPPPPAPLPMPAPKPKASAGYTGGKVALRIEKRARIVDYDAALQALKDTPEVREAVEKLAQRAVRAGLTVAGVTVDEVEKAA